MQQPRIGGAVKSDRAVHPDFVHDTFSAFYPLAQASPALQALQRLMEAEAAGDGSAWLDLCQQWERLQEPLLEALMAPFPPVRAGARLAFKLGPSAR